MAIHAHEGLPRSGKSYEAAVYIILEALKNGRHVWAYVEGLNHKKFAELAGITEGLCKKLLVQLEYDDVINIPKRSQEEQWKDGWIIIDEIQDFYPGSTRKLDQLTSKFVTQHGHDGLDILIMGQSMSDVHTLWRNRITQKTQFLKRDAVGKDNTYLWTTYKGKLDGNGKIRFEKIRSGVRPYDNQYFGLYASHTEGTTNTDNHNDDRANIFKGSGFRTWLPVFGLVLVFAVYYLFSFFTDSGVISKEQFEQAGAKTLTIANEFEKQKQIALEPERVETPIKHDEFQSIPEPEEYQPIDYADRMANEYKPRLTGFIAGENKLVGIVEFLDTSYKVHERLNFRQLRSMGWKIEIIEDYIHFTKLDKKYVVTAWPVEPFGSIASSTRNSLGGSMIASNQGYNTAPRKARSHMIKNESKYKGIYRSSN